MRRPRRPPEVRYHHRRRDRRQTAHRRGLPLRPRLSRAGVPDRGPDRLRRRGRRRSHDGHELRARRRARRRHAGADLDPHPRYLHRRGNPAARKSRLPQHQLPPHAAIDSTSSNGTASHRGPLAFRHPAAKGRDLRLESPQSRAASLARKNARHLDRSEAQWRPLYLSSPGRTASRRGNAVQLSNNRHHQPTRRSNELFERAGSNWQGL